MNARFSLRNSPSAAACATEIVQAMLIGWSCLGVDDLVGAGAVLSAAVAHARTAPASFLIIELSHADGELQISVGAYERLDLPPVYEEAASTPAAITEDRVEPHRPVAPRPDVTAGSPDDCFVTLADLADRLAESEWFIQRRVASGTLPPPDAADDAGSPVWHGSTIADWEHRRDQGPQRPGQGSPAGSSTESSPEPRSVVPRDADQAARR